MMPQDADLEDVAERLAVLVLAAAERRQNHFVGGAAGALRWTWCLSAALEAALTVD